MRDLSFIGYIQDADYHDATVLRVEQSDDVVRVRIRGYDGNEFVSEFSSVQALRATRAEGMFLYALSEMRGEPPLRRFVFVNWDDDDAAALEIDAKQMRVYDGRVD